MSDMQPGLRVDNAALIEVLNAKVAQAAVRDAQMEAAIQALLSEQADLLSQNKALNGQVADLEQKLNPPAEEDGS